MKKVIAVIIALVLVVSLTACGWNKCSSDMEANDGRITLIYNDGFVRIYADNQTGVQYMNNGGLCVMVDEKGNPLIYRTTEKGGAE